MCTFSFLCFVIVTVNLSFSLLSNYNISISRTCFFLFITPILKLLVVPVIWLALIGAIYARFAPFFALNLIFFPANEQASLKSKQPIRFQGLFKVTNQIAGKWKTNSIVANFATFVSKLLFFSFQNMHEFNFKPAQYCINNIFELTKSCIWAISKWM